MPVLRAQKQLRTLSAGAVLELVSSDAVSWNEVPAFCEQAGHRLIHREAANDEWRFWIEKRPSS